MKRTSSDPARKNRSIPERQRETEQHSSTSRNGPDPVDSLHRSVGNQAVQRLYEKGDLQAQREVGQSGDESEREAEGKPREKTEGPKTVRRREMEMWVQPKLTVSSPRDPAEREAERVAEEVMLMPELETAIDGDEESRRKPTSDTLKSKGEESSPDPPTDMCSRCIRQYRAGKPLNCEECERSLGEGPVQRQLSSSPSAPSIAGADEESLIRSVRNREGRKLPESVKSFFEPRFGYGFDDVQVHTGARADEAARSVNAEAFTVGTDIVFRSRAYQPFSKGGKRLLAHELAHVVQQNSHGKLNIQRQVAGGCNPCPRPVDPDVDLAIRPVPEYTNLGGGHFGHTDWQNADVPFVSIQHRERRNCNTCGPGGNSPEFDLCPREAVVRATVPIQINRNEVTRRGPNGERWYQDCNNINDRRFITQATAQASMSDPKRITVASTRIHERYHISVSEDILENQLSNRNDIDQVCPYNRADIDNWVDALETDWQNSSRAILRGNPGGRGEENDARRHECNNI